MVTYVAMVTSCFLHQQPLVACCTLLLACRVPDAASQQQAPPAHPACVNRVGCGGDGTWEDAVASFGLQLLPNPHDYVQHMLSELCVLAQEWRLGDPSAAAAAADDDDESSIDPGTCC
jgi:hypothetical protein